MKYVVDHNVVCEVTRSIATTWETYICVFTRSRRDGLVVRRNEIFDSHEAAENHRQSQINHNILTQRHIIRQAHNEIARLKGLQ